MKKRLSGPSWLDFESCLLLTLLLPLSNAAPLQESTEISGVSPSGCYYNYNHYSEGDRILTNEPCLNCTCHNEMLMCYLRVCPFMKPVDQDCIIEKREDQCCPIITCPEVPVEIDHSANIQSTALSIADRYGCTIDNKFYPEGSQLPSNPKKPCELCYCLRNMTSCVMQECTLHIDGCSPIYNRGVCCPTRYECSHEFDELPQIEDQSESTTIRPTEGYILTTTESYTRSCTHNGESVLDGVRIETDEPCANCYCMRGDIVCAVQECTIPMEYQGRNCTAKAKKSDQCCPEEYDCSDAVIVEDHVTEEEPIKLMTKLPNVDHHTTEKVSDSMSQVDSTTLHAEMEHEPEDSDHLNEIDEDLHGEIVHKDDVSNKDKAIPQSAFMTTTELFISKDDEELQEHIDVHDVDDKMIYKHPEQSDEHTTVKSFEESKTDETFDAEATTILSSEIKTEKPELLQPGSSTSSFMLHSDVSTSTETMIDDISEEHDRTHPATTELIKEMDMDINTIIPSVVPGEGACLVGRITYANNENVPISNKCEASCLCINSVVHCEPIKCAPAPVNAINCAPIYDEQKSCCPTYNCESIVDTETSTSIEEATGKEIEIKTAVPENKTIEIERSTTMPLVPEELEEDKVNILTTVLPTLVEIITKGKDVKSEDAGFSEIPIQESMIPEVHDITTEYIETASEIQAKPSETTEETIVHTENLNTTEKLHDHMTPSSVSLLYDVKIEPDETDEPKKTTESSEQNISSTEIQITEHVEEITRTDIEAADQVTEKELHKMTVATKAPDVQTSYLPPDHRPTLSPSEDHIDLTLPTHDISMETTSIKYHEDKVKEQELESLPEFVSTHMLEKVSGTTPEKSVESTEPMETSTLKETDQHEGIPSSTTHKILLDVTELSEKTEGSTAKGTMELTELPEQYKDSSTEIISLDESEIKKAVEHSEQPFENTTVLDTTELPEKELESPSSPSKEEVELTESPKDDKQSTEKVMDSTPKEELELTESPEKQTENLSEVVVPFTESPEEHEVFSEVTALNTKIDEAHKQPSEDTTILEQVQPEDHKEFSEDAILNAEVQGEQHRQPVEQSTPYGELDTVRHKDHMESTTLKEVIEDEKHTESFEITTHTTEDMEDHKETTHRITPIEEDEAEKHKITSEDTTPKQIKEPEVHKEFSEGTTRKGEVEVEEHKEPLDSTTTKDVLDTDKHEEQYEHTTPKDDVDVEKHREPLEDTIPKDEVSTEKHKDNSESTTVKEMIKTEEHTISFESTTQKVIEEHIELLPGTSKPEQTDYPKLEEPYEFIENTSSKSQPIPSETPIEKSTEHVESVTTLEILDSTEVPLFMSEEPTKSIEILTETPTIEKETIPEILSTEDHEKSTVALTDFTPGPELFEESSKGEISTSKESLLEIAVPTLESKPEHTEETSKENIFMKSTKSIDVTTESTLKESELETSSEQALEASKKPQESAEISKEISISVKDPLEVPAEMTTLRLIPDMVEVTPESVNKLDESTIKIQSEEETKKPLVETDAVTIIPIKSINEADVTVNENDKQTEGIHTHTMEESTKSSELDLSTIYSEEMDGGLDFKEGSGFPEKDIESGTTDIVKISTESDDVSSEMKETEQKLPDKETKLEENQTVLSIEQEPVLVDQLLTTIQPSDIKETKDEQIITTPFYNVELPKEEFPTSIPDSLSQEKNEEVPEKISEAPEKMDKIQPPTESSHSQGDQRTDSLVIKEIETTSKSFDEIQNISTSTASSHTESPKEEETVSKLSTSTSMTLPEQDIVTQSDVTVSEATAVTSASVAEDMKPEHITLSTISKIESTVISEIIKAEGKPGSTFETDEAHDITTSSSKEEVATKPLGEKLEDSDLDKQTEPTLTESMTEQPDEQPDHIPSNETDAPQLPDQELSSQHPLVLDEQPSVIHPEKENLTLVHEPVTTEIKETPTHVSTIVPPLFEIDQKPDGAEPESSHPLITMPPVLEETNKQVEEEPAEVKDEIPHTTTEYQEVSTSTTKHSLDEITGGEIKQPIDLPYEQTDKIEVKPTELTPKDSPTSESISDLLSMVSTIASSHTESPQKDDTTDGISSLIPLIIPTKDLVIVERNVTTAPSVVDDHFVPELTVTPETEKIEKTEMKLDTAIPNEDISEKLTTPSIPEFTTQLPEASTSEKHKTTENPLKPFASSSIQPSVYIVTPSEIEPLPTEIEQKYTQPPEQPAVDQQKEISTTVQTEIFKEIEMPSSTQSPTVAPVEHIMVAEMEKGDSTSTQKPVPEFVNTEKPLAIPSSSPADELLTSTQSDILLHSSSTVTAEEISVTTEKLDEFKEKQPLTTKSSLVGSDYLTPKPSYFTETPITSSSSHSPPAAPLPSGPASSIQQNYDNYGTGSQNLSSTTYTDEYTDEEDPTAFGPGTCRYGGKLYVSAQQIPRDDPCDFCFCFRSDIICLQQSCPPPISGCHEEPIQGFCCPRYECPVSMATAQNVTTTTTTTTLPPHFLHHAYNRAAQPIKHGCQIQGHSYQVGEVIKSASGPCMHCVCGGDGQMKCDPKVCTPEPMLRQMIAIAASRKR